MYKNDNFFFCYSIIKGEKFLVVYKRCIDFIVFLYDLIIELYDWVYVSWLKGYVYLDILG